MVSKKTDIRIISPNDREYEAWSERRVNLRFRERSAGIIPVSSVDQLMAALQQTIDLNKYVTVRGGGHCLENFVDAPGVEVIIDISQLKGIRFDPEKKAIEVMAGNTLGEMHEKLQSEWGVFVPSGEHPAIGVGGHFSGGAFGFFCRKYGLGADYLYAVEMLYVDEERKVKKVVATREERDVNRELWWAHTGGGPGNFGIATRYWFRNEGSDDNDPSRLLPRVPSEVETIELEWDWKTMTETSFHQLVSNFCNWAHENNGTDASCNLFVTIHLFTKTAGKIKVKGILADVKEKKVVDDFIEAIGNQTSAPFTIRRKQLTWLNFVLHPFPDIFVDQKGAFKVKDAFMIAPFSDDQINVMYNYLSVPDVPGAGIGFATYGGKVNAVDSHATASVQRRAIMTTACNSGWGDVSDEAKNLDWLRNCYNDLFAESGGAPVPGEKFGGCIIAHPDNDLDDPEYNRSGVPWHVFYYQHNYSRLQEVKRKWDPCNVFRHALSIG